MSLEKYSMTMPRTVYSGMDALENLKTIAKDAKKVAIFTDRGILSTGLVDLPLAKLQEAGKETIVISDLPPEPTYMQVQKLVDEFKASGADFIVAVGGGSAMDTAKLASLLATERYTVKDLLGDYSTPYHALQTIIAQYNADHDPEEQLPRIPFHGLRHTSATLLISEGHQDPRTVANRLGHAQTSTTLNIYTHALREGDRRAASALESILDPKK